MKLLLSHEDIQLNLQDAEGETPLMSAIQLHKQARYILLSSKTAAKQYLIVSHRICQNPSIKSIELRYALFWENADVQMSSFYISNSLNTS